MSGKKGQKVPRIKYTIYTSNHIHTPFPLGMPWALDCPSPSPRDLLDDLAGFFVGEGFDIVLQ